MCCNGATFFGALISPEIQKKEPNNPLFQQQKIVGVFFTRQRNFFYVFAWFRSAVRRSYDATKPETMMPQNQVLWHHNFAAPPNEIKRIRKKVALSGEEHANYFFLSGSLGTFLDFRWHQSTKKMAPLQHTFRYQIEILKNLKKNMYRYLLDQAHMLMKEICFYMPRGGVIDDQSQNA